MDNALFWWLVFPMLVAAAVVYLVLVVIGLSTIRIAFSLSHPLLKIALVSIGLMVIASPLMYHALMDLRAQHEADGRQAALADLERVNLAGRLPETFITVGDFGQEVISFIETNYPLRTYSTEENKRLVDAYRNYRKAERCHRRFAGEVMPGTKIPKCKKLPASVQSALDLREPVLVFATGRDTSMREDNVLAGKIYEIRLITPQEDVLVAYYEQRTVEGTTSIFSPYAPPPPIGFQRPGATPEDIHRNGDAGSKPMIDLLGQAIGIVFGGVIVVALMSMIYKRDAVDWEQLVTAYGRDWTEPRLLKRFANMILYSDGRPAKSYPAMISIGLYDDGIAFRPNRVLVPFQRPVFIPYADIQGWDQNWYLDAKSTELSFRKAPHMRIIMPHEQVEWMLSLAKGPPRISAERPPHGTRPWITYYVALASGAMALVVIIVTFWKGLPIAFQEQPLEFHSHQLPSEDSNR